MIWVIGAGGHAKVVAETAFAASSTVAGFLDDDPLKQGTALLGLRVEGPILSGMSRLGVHRWVLGIGDNRVRRHLVERGLPAEPVTLVHPTAIVSPSARLGTGTVAFAAAIVQAEARVGSHAVLNTRATVEHDVVVGDFAHIAPGAVLLGGAEVGTGVLVGAGAVVLPGIRIGEGAVVGAGSVVAKNVPAGATVVGVPARTRQVP
jgi:acetyltransferase EpsM